MLLELDLGLSLLLHQSVPHILAHSSFSSLLCWCATCSDLKLLECRAQIFSTKFLFHIFRCSFSLSCCWFVIRNVMNTYYLFLLFLSLSQKSAIFFFIYIDLLLKIYLFLFKSWLVYCVKRLKSTQANFQMKYKFLSSDTHAAFPVIISRSLGARLSANCIDAHFYYPWPYLVRLNSYSSCRWQQLKQVS